ncbi:hypothetical protein METHB2_10129 [Candidatus Methylobacter favarea]|uniref:Uncharacterized protein n=1 Tax=Candidatus Methylobacter favarea TaxID=2707345 RepID=A0A8S0WGN2_9GAMM|nr:hypothetical protein METHB2_10129 [Candidatus Methylobacter favarea]
MTHNYSPYGYSFIKYSLRILLTTASLAEHGYAGEIPFTLFCPLSSMRFSTLRQLS